VAEVEALPQGRGPEDRLSKGKTYGAISSVGCKDEKWKTVVVTNVYRGQRDEAGQHTVSCAPPKKR
jgi:hypothetical protein